MENMKGKDFGPDFRDEDFDIGSFTSKKDKLMEQKKKIEAELEREEMQENIPKQREHMAGKDSRGIK